MRAIQTPVGTRAGDGTRGHIQAAHVHPSSPTTSGHSRFVPKALATWPVSTSCTALVIPHPGHHQPVTAWMGHGIVGSRRARPGSARAT